MKYTLQRLGVFNGATIGLLNIDDLPPIWTLERPYKDDGTGRIPAGNYICTPHGWHDEPVEKKDVWELQNVPGREAILIHAGNTLDDTKGCILVGLGLTIADTTAIWKSQAALELLRKRYPAIGFGIQILDA